MFQAVYDAIVTTAKSRGTAYYSDIAPVAGLDFDRREDRNTISKFLDEINDRERAEGRPLLSAVVISKRDGKPSEGFFNVARRQGLHDGTDDRAFWEEELARVHQHWGTTSDVSPAAPATKGDLNAMAQAITDHVDGQTAPIRRLLILVATKVGLTESEIDEALAGKKHEPDQGIW